MKRIALPALGRCTSRHVAVQPAIPFAARRVLQRDRPVLVRCRADADEQVAAELAARKKSASAPATETGGWLRAPAARRLFRKSRPAAGAPRGDLFKR